MARTDEFGYSETPHDERWARPSQYAQQQAQDAAAVAAQPPAAPVMFPPHLYPPDDATEFTLTAVVALAGPANEVQAPAEVELTTNEGELGVVRVITLFIDAPVAATDVRFRFRLDGKGVEGYEDLRIPGRAASSIERTIDAAIRLKPNSKLSVLIANIDGAARRAAVTISGWTYPKR